MNGYDVDVGDFESVDSFLFRDSDSEAYDTDTWEARGRRSPRPVPTAKGRPLTTPRTGPGGGGTGNFVTQAQLDAALARARTEITANATAIKTVDSRVRTSISDMQRLQSITRKDMDKLQSDLRTTQTLSALVPMLTANASDKIKSLAPLVHLLPSGTLTGSSSTSGGTQPSSNLLGGNNNNLIAIAAIAFASGAFKG
jgi:hypothetical protein